MTIRLAARYLATSCFSIHQATSALRPFFFAIHPDLFGTEPEKQSLNNTALQNLNEHIDCLARGVSVKPLDLQFHVRDLQNRTVTKKVKIRLQPPKHDLRKTVSLLLQSVGQQAAELETIDSSLGPLNVTFEPDQAWFDRQFGITRSSTQQAFNLADWLSRVAPVARELRVRHAVFDHELRVAAQSFCTETGAASLSWQATDGRTGWSASHLLASLHALRRAACPDWSPLVGRHLRLHSSSDVSYVDAAGTVNLSTRDVPDRWVAVLRYAEPYLRLSDTVQITRAELSEVLFRIHVEFDPTEDVRVVLHNLEVLLVRCSRLQRSGKLQTVPMALLSDVSLFVDSSSASPFVCDATGTLHVNCTIDPHRLMTFMTDNAHAARMKAARAEHEQGEIKRLLEQLEQDLRLPSCTADPRLGIDDLRVFADRLRELEGCADALAGQHLYASLHTYRVDASGRICIPV